MLVNIEDIKIEKRIRKDMGNLEDLANDIKENGLINPPVVTTDLVLIAGERRLQAMKLLGYQQIEVRTFSPKDSEHQLMLEISENEERKDFTKLERLDWARQLERIERVKAKERMLDPTKNSTEGVKGETTEIVAKKTGIGSKDTYRKEKYIADNADEETLDKWNKEEISTNKAYQKIKELEKQLSEKEEDLKEQSEINLSLAYELEEERNKEPEVVEKEVVKEVVPDDYHLTKQQLEQMQEVIRKQKAQIDRQKIDNKLLKAQEQNTKEELESEKFVKKKISQITDMTVTITEFIDKMGGMLYMSEYVDLMPLEYRKVFLKAVTHLRDFADQLYFNLEDEINKIGDWRWQMQSWQTTKC